MIDQKFLILYEFELKLPVSPPDLHQTCRRNVVARVPEAGISAHA